MQGLLTQQTTPSLVVDILEAVAKREGVDETELPPLFEVLDPDALEALFAPSPRGAPRGPNLVSFEFCGYLVHIDGDRNVTVG